MNDNQNRSLIEIWFRRVWTEGESEAIDDMMVSSTKAIGLGGNPIVGPEQFKVFHQKLSELISNFEITVEKHLEHEEWAAAYCTLKGKSRRDRTDVKINGMVFVKFEDGKIVEGYNSFDFMSLWCQLGLLPADCFEQGLEGNKVV